ncbi:MAG TPA: hypothetical protein DCL09_05905, partial [Sutterella sp.]|nr:hypothetical protein [Sutterella sp.]
SCGKFCDAWLMIAAKTSLDDLLMAVFPHKKKRGNTDPFPGKRFPERVEVMMACRMVSVLIVLLKPKTEEPRKYT